MIEGLLIILKEANKEYTYFQSNFEVGKGIKKNEKPAFDWMQKSAI
jgi:hypothetical protein